MIRQKTDRSDAELIANYCLHNDPRLWRPRKPEYKQLHEANSFLDSLKVELNRLNNQLEKSYENDRVKKSITDRINFTKKQIKDLENEAEQIIMNSSELKRNFEIITSIKGVGKRLACAILADTYFERFENGKQFAAFAGVTPFHFESGTSIKGRSRISRIGSSKLRKILYMNALVVKKHNEYFADFVRKLQEKGKGAKVIIVAIMRKLMCVIYGMLKSQQKFDKKFAFPS